MFGVTNFMEIKIKLKQTTSVALFNILTILTLNLLNFLDRIIRLSFLELSIVIFRDIKVRT